jgi:membrane-associated protein
VLGAAAGIFGVVASTLFLPLPEELALLGAGYVAHSGALPLWLAWIAAWAGIVVGDTTTFLVGRSFLPALLRSRFGRRFVGTDLRQWAEDLVARHGFRAILLGRFLVALRGPVYLAIGAARYPLAKFELLNGLVGLVEVAILVGLGYVFGKSTKIEHNAVWLEVTIAVVMALILVVPAIFKWRMVKKQRAR